MNFPLQPEIGSTGFIAPRSIGGKVAAKMSISHVSPTISQLLPLLIPGPDKTPGNGLWKNLEKGDLTFLAQLRQHRLAPLLYAEIVRQSRQIFVDPKFLQVLRHDFLCAVQVSTRQEQEAIRVIQALSAAAMNPIILKGMDLRLRVYQNSAERPISDLDILIDQAQVPQTRKILASLDYALFTNSVDPFPGYWEHFGHELGFFPPKGGVLPIEVHWEIRAVNSLYHIPYRAVRHKTVLVDFQGTPIRVLDREHLLMHLCLHAFSHFHDDKLKSLPTYILIDIGLTLRRLGVDWSVFLQIAENFHCQAPIYFTLREVARLIPHDIPPAVLAELRRHQPGLVEKAALSLRLRFVTKTLAVMRHHPPREWLPFLRGNLWPDSEYLLANYGKPDRLAYWRQFFKKNILLKNR